MERASLILAFRLSVSAIIVLSMVQLVSGQHRTFDGMGNNVANPTWGAAHTSYVRMETSVYYSDGIASPSGETLPNPRVISNRIGEQTLSLPDPRGLSDFTWQWGQFLDHDIALTRGGGDAEPLPIMVDDSSDPLSPMIPFARSAYDPSTGSGTDNPREQMNDNTAFIDGSAVYGSDLARADALRTFRGGRLATSAGNLLPVNTLSLPNVNEGSEPDNMLFLAGDVRANEQLGLTAMHTLWMREHNRLADEMTQSHPDWSDEQIYQHARGIVGGLIESITFNEYLPALLGSAAPDLANAAYDPAVNPTLANEFVTAAFRLGHTQVSPQLLRVDQRGHEAEGGPVSVKDAFFVPSRFLSAPEEVDYLLKGMASQVQQRTDVKMIDELRHAMFGPPGAGGLDLFALNVQRGRDHGLAGYNDLRRAMGMDEATVLTDVTSDAELARVLTDVYGDVDKIDLWVGLLAEDPLPGSAVGELLGNVLSSEFQKLIEGDRHFFLWDTELSDSEINAIMNTRLSDVIRRNTEITGLQQNVFFVPEPPGAILAISALAMVVGLYRFL